jgi:hypothetical protein
MAEPEILNRDGRTSAMGEVGFLFQHAFHVGSPPISAIGGLLDPEPPFASETPINAASRRHRADHMLAEFLLQGRSPGYQLESETIIDHRKSSGREGDALAIAAGYMLALSGGMMGEPGLRRESGNSIVQFAPPQRIEKIAGKDHSLPLALGQTHLDKMIGAPVHGIADLGTEATAADRWLTREKLAINPGCPPCRGPIS